jgi:hypothetical protein
VSSEEPPAVDTTVAHSPRIRNTWNQAGSLPYVLRTPEQIARCFDGLEVLEPGVVPCSLWRPEEGEVGSAVPVDEFGAVGRKP